MLAFLLLLLPSQLCLRHSEGLSWRNGSYEKKLDVLFTGFLLEIITLLEMFDRAVRGEFAFVWLHLLQQLIAEFVAVSPLGKI